MFVDYYICFEFFFLDYFGNDCVVLLHVLGFGLTKLNCFVWMFWMVCWLMLDSFI
jgi:hypothetical protein